MIARLRRATPRKALRLIARNATLRRATRRARILPTFIIIGAQRAGTTSLYDYLSRHPDVAVAVTPPGDVWWSKEVHFFDYRFWRGLDWYRSCFPLALSRSIARRRGRGLVAGEATPTYLLHPAVPERVAATLPDVRLIALLRDPIERAYSHYQLMVRTRREKLSFEDALDAEEERIAGEVERMLADPRYKSAAFRDHTYVTRGLYADQLERWFKHFPREQLLVLGAEEFLAQPAETYEEVLSFIGLRPWRLQEYAPRNRATYAPIDPQTRARLEERFAEPNARLFELLGREFAWGQRGQTAARAGTEPAVSRPG
jgi:lipopolysaccharide transport system ATP-binding protein